MEINTEELIKKEIHQQVKHRMDNHFNTEIKRVLSRSGIKNEIVEQLENHINEIIDIDSIIEKMDLEKIHADIVARASYAIARKLDCEEYL